MSIIFQPIRTETLKHSLLATTLQNVKDNLRITDTDEDSLLTEYLESATDRLESWLGMSFLFSERISFYDYCSSCADGFLIRGREFIEIQKFEFFSDGAYEELDSTDFFLKKTDCDTKICLKSCLTVDREVTDPVRITFSLGFKNDLEQSSFVFTDPTVTVTAVAHDLAVGDPVYVTGSDPDDFNGIQTVLTVPDLDTFTFDLSTSPASPTGTIIVFGPAVPKLVQLGIKQMVASMYANRGDCCDECGDIPCAVRSNLRGLKKVIIRTSRGPVGCQCC